MSPDAAASSAIANRYTRRVALRHERMYGRGYQGPGSEEVFASLAGRLELRSGLRVLDVGSGLGGDSFRLADRFGVTVTGLDASPDMTAICRERAAEDGVRGVTFITGDARTTDLDPGSLDVIWSRDCGLYVPPPERPAMWMRLRQALRPGGQVLLTDYGRGPTSASAGFEDHLAATGQFPVTAAEYAEVFATAGFTAIATDDRTEDLLGSMLEERRRLITDKDSFLADFTSEEYAGLVDRWDKKIAWCRQGELAWIVLTARRPAP